MQDDDQTGSPPGYHPFGLNDPGYLSITDPKSRRRWRWRENQRRHKLGLPSLGAEAGNRLTTPPPVGQAEPKAPRVNADRLRPRFLGDDPGLLAEPHESWNHLLPMTAGDTRRRAASVAVIVTAEFRATWERVYLAKRTRVRGWQHAA